LLNKNITMKNMSSYIPKSSTFLFIIISIFLLFIFISYFLLYINLSDNHKKRMIEYNPYLRDRL
jgi:hypothetical protein